MKTPYTGTQALSTFDEIAENGLKPNSDSFAIGFMDDCSKTPDGLKFLGTLHRAGYSVPSFVAGMELGVKLAQKEATK